MPTSTLTVAQALDVLREMADKVSISHGYARSMARGLIPGEEVRDRIASALGVDAAEIWHP
jgi:lambda repressor-like predicted transcriptional regulator